MMNEKNHIVLIIALFAIAVSASFGAGYWLRSTVQQAGQSDNEFRAELEAKQGRINELEARLGDLGNLVSDGFGNVIGTVGRVQGYVDLALEQSGDIRTTVNLIREAVKELENSERYFRELASRLSDSQRNSGGE